MTLEDCDDLTRDIFSAVLSDDAAAWPGLVQVTLDGVVLDDEAADNFAQFVRAWSVWHAKDAERTSERLTVKLRRSSAPPWLSAQLQAISNIKLIFIYEADVSHGSQSEEKEESAEEEDGIL